jgi:cytochrome c peroxidase
MHKPSLLSLLLLTSVLAYGEDSSRHYSRAEAKQRYTRPSSIPFPKDNAFTPARELLGRTLFFDTRLSGSGWISCASCHNPSIGWGDGLPLAIGDGMKTLGRRTPTILNLAWEELLFWDGRSESLESQALDPIKAVGEMNLTREQLTAKVQSIPGYKPLFAAAYPGEPVEPDTIARAIANFERTVVSGTAPFDRWIAGDETAISENAKTGFDLFNTKARCAVCHEGWAFTDRGFHDIGVPGDDLGRGEHLKLEAMQYAFKTPTLRNLTQRAPYLHNGSEPTLAAVIDFYDQGGKARRPSLSPELVPLKLTKAEKAALEEFLRTLSSVDAPVTIPVMPH